MIFVPKYSLISLVSESFIETLLMTGSCVVKVKFMPKNVVLEGKRMFRAPSNYLKVIPKKLNSTICWTFNKLSFEI